MLFRTQEAGHRPIAGVSLRKIAGGSLRNECFLGKKSGAV